jgi:hypothetical protein
MSFGNQYISLLMQSRKMDFVTQLMRIVASSVLLAYLAGCNPIGQDDETAGNQSPTVDAGSDQLVVEAASVSLIGTADDSDGTIAQISWVQSAGPTTQLSAASTLSATFVAPSISTPVTLIYRLTVEDNAGASATDTITILVDPDPALNDDPVGNAGTNQTVASNAQVTLDASGSSDADGTVQSYSWQPDPGNSLAVSIVDTSAALTSFIAPNIGVPTDLRFLLIVTDNEGATSTPASVVVTVVVPTGGNVEIGGRVSFDMVPHNANGGLDYEDIQNSPARGISVEAVAVGNQAIIATTSTDATGNFSLSVPAQVDIFIRARAEMVSTGGPAEWDFAVYDNNGIYDFSDFKPIYVLDGIEFNSGVNGATVNMHADSGWDSSARFYLRTRAAAPFAILDVVYDALNLALEIDPELTLPELSLNWSTRNSVASNSIQGTGYASGQIFILGTEEQDTDEYDRHVVAHEWGHFFEEAVSRDDSVGGQHSLADHLDARTALSEGWGNAFSAMVTGDEDYVDSCCLEQSSASVIFSLEENRQEQGRSLGWYSECSVGSLLYDIFDTSPGEVDDNLSMGLGPIYEVLSGEQATTSALTTVFSFVNTLRSNNASSVPGIDTLLQNQNIQTAGQDEYGAAETDNGGNADALPLYHNGLFVGGAAINVCTNSTDGEYNKTGNRRYVRFRIDSAASYTIRALTTDSVAGSSPDPDFELFLSGSLTESLRPPAIEEVLATFLEVGDYVLEIWDDNNISAAQLGSLDPGRYCVDLTVSGS